MNESSDKPLLGNYPVRPQNWTLLVLSSLSLFTDSPQLLGEGKSKLQEIIDTWGSCVSTFVFVIPPALQSRASAMLATALPRRHALTMQLVPRAGLVDQVWLGLQHCRTNNVAVLWNEAKLSIRDIQLGMRAHRYCSILYEDLSGGNDYPDNRVVLSKLKPLRAAVTTAHEKGEKEFPFSVLRWMKNVTHLPVETLHVRADNNETGVQVVSKGNTRQSLQSRLR